MKFFLAASLMSALAEGFILPSRTAAPRLVFKHHSKQASYRNQLLEKSDLLSEDVVEQEFSSPVIPDMIEKEPEVDEVVDVGKELFLSKIEENAEVASTDFDVVEDPIMQAPQQTQKANLQPLSVQDDVLDNVSAVLSASEEAMAAAEATLPADIADTLLSQSDDADSAATSIRVVNVSEPVEAPVREILPASSVVGEPVTTEQVVAPRVSKILRFAIPAIGVWLCGPLLSLIDTSSVGLLSGTTQQAALNPAVALTDYTALLIAFLYTGTTNLIAAARESDRDTAGMPRTAKTFVGAMQLSTYVGAGLGLVLFTFARPLLRAIIGNDAIGPAVFDAAMKYVRIRALGMPAAAVIGSAQAACLGMQDIRSPLYVLGVAAIVNFMGDMLFVANSNPWIGGAAGAAWATVFSQYAAVAIFVRWLCTSIKPKNKPENETPTVNLSQAILELTGKPKSAGAGRRKRFRDALRSFRNPTFSSQDNKGETVIRGGGRLSMQLPKAVKSVTEKKQNDEEGFSVRGFLAKRFRGRDLLKFPNKDTVKEVGEYVVPVTCTQVGRVSGYVAMSHVVTSSLGIISMAAQQVIVSLFYCLCPVADSLSLTAQSFVPAIQEKKASVERSKALKETAVNFAKAGAIFGGFMAVAVSCIPLLSGFFTSDIYVSSLVNMVAPLLICIFAVHGIVCSMEGILLGRKDLSFLGKMYAAYFAFVPYFMLRVKRAALSGTHNVNLTSVWKVFLSYQLFRCVVWLARVGLLQRRTHREAQALGEQP